MFFSLTVLVSFQLVCFQSPSWCAYTLYWLHTELSDDVTNPSISQVT